jgi:hypothetical protein
MYQPSLNGGAVPDRLIIVKAFCLIVALALGCADGFAEDWTTLDGINYRDVKVIRVEDDAITIIYKDGGALVPIAKLPVALQQRYSYDPVKAKAAADARAKAESESAKQLQLEIQMTEKLKREQQVKDAEAKGQTNAPPK